MSIGILLLFALPGGPDNARPLLFGGLIRFSEEEASILRARLEREDSEKKGGAQGMRIPLKVVWKTLRHYRRWSHYLATACVFATWSPLTTYTPSIMKSVPF